MHNRTKKGHTADAFDRLIEKRRERQFRARRRSEEARSIFAAIQDRLNEALSQPATMRMA